MLTTEKIKDEFESFNNLILIGNGLQHIKFEIERENPSYFRVGRESHLILYRSMIEVLKGSANTSIIGRRSKTRQRFYRIGNDPWKEIHKEEITGCSKAWRFSIPSICEEPKIDYKNINPLPYPKSNEYLISFYDTLAMMQTDCFMHQFVMSKSIEITDDEMKSLEWLHENIRNEFEHFIPKSYSVAIIDLAQISILCLRKAKELIFDSKNVISASDHKNYELEIEYISHKINQLMAG